MELASLIKGHSYKTAIEPSMLYDEAKCWAMKKQEVKAHVEIHMPVDGASGNRIRNEPYRKTNGQTQ